jgi:hypothetical protein
MCGLNRPDVGWYQVRKALQDSNASGDFPPVSFDPVEVAYKQLTNKLQPMVYELGFLKQYLKREREQLYPSPAQVSASAAEKDRDSQST